MILSICFFLDIPVIPSLFNIYFYVEFYVHWVSSSKQRLGRAVGACELQLLLAVAGCGYQVVK